VLLIFPAGFEHPKFELADPAVPAHLKTLLATGVIANLAPP
jgi:hypothetical protein